MNSISHSFKLYINGISDRNSLLPTQYLFISRPTSIFTFLLCRASSLFWATLHPAKGLHIPPSLAAREAASEMTVKVIGQCFWKDPLKRLSCQVYPCPSSRFPPSYLEYEWGGWSSSSSLVCNTPGGWAPVLNMVEQEGLRPSFPWSLCISQPWRPTSRFVLCHD